MKEMNESTNKKTKSTQKTTPQKQQEDDGDPSNDPSVSKALDMIGTNPFLKDSMDFEMQKDSGKALNENKKEHDTQKTTKETNTTTENETQPEEEENDEHEMTEYKESSEEEEEDENDQNNGEDDEERENENKENNGEDDEEEEDENVNENDKPDDLNDDEDDDDQEEEKRKYECKKRKSPNKEQEKKEKRKAEDIQGRKTRSAAKKQKIDTLDAATTKKRKRIEKPKKQTKKDNKKATTKKGKEKPDEEEKKKGKKEGTTKNIDPQNNFKVLKSKTTIQPLYAVTKTLTSERKSVLTQMGFGSLLDFKFEKIPRKVVYFVLKNLNTKTMTVKLTSGGKLKITQRKIWEVLGVPMRKVELKIDSSRDWEDELKQQFLAQFPTQKRYYTITDLSKVIQNTTNTDFMFQLNYLMLFANCLIECKSSSFLTYEVLKNIRSTDVISDFNWCKYILKAFPRTKSNWNDTIFENWYYGPSLVLLKSL